MLFFTMYIHTVAIENTTQVLNGEVPYHNTHDLLSDCVITQYSYTFPYDWFIM